ncbi:hypothetical protein DQG13_23870 [Paenibacillus sp. YN15]|nr:hypothetical protein DQG13_23870 [Paenibacillus sp. YN15]
MEETLPPACCAPWINGLIPAILKTVRFYPFTVGFLLFGPRQAVLQYIYLLGAVSKLRGEQILQNFRSRQGTFVKAYRGYVKRK